MWSCSTSEVSTDTFKISFLTIIEAPHLVLEKDSPDPRPIQPPDVGLFIAIPQLGGLHHRYEQREGRNLPHVANFRLAELSKPGSPHTDFPDGPTISIEHRHSRVIFR